MEILIVLLVIFVHILLLSKMIFFPYPELFIYPYLTKIGLVPYKQILDQHFPGLMFFPVNLATLGFDSPSKMRILQYLMVFVSQILIYLISVKIFKKSIFKLLPNMLYLIWQPYFEGYVLWIESFITPIILTTFLLALNFEKNKSQRTIFFTGFMFGIATLFKQVIFPVTGIYFIYLWIKHKKIKYLEQFAFGVCLPLIYLLYYVYVNKNFSDFFYWTYTFNVTIFATMGRKYATLSDLMKISVVYGLNLLLIVFYYIKARKKKISNDFVLISIFWVSSFIFAYARFDFVHLQPSLPFALISIVYALKYINETYKNKAVLVFLLISLFFVFRNYRYLFVNKVMFYGQSEKSVSNIVSQYSNPGDSVFAFGTLPNLYQMTNTHPPGNIFVFQFPWFMKVAEGRVLNGLQTDSPRVVVRDNTANVSGTNLVNYMANIGEYVNKYYHTIERVGEVEIMIPN